MTTTSELLLAADRLRPRSQQQGIGMSDLGDCRRRTGYKLAGTKPVNPQGSVQAMIGSAVHDAVAQQMRLVAQPGDLVEYGIEFAGVKGSLDRYECESQTVVDTKTTSSRWLEHIKLHGPEHGQIWQVSGYAAALVAEGYKVQRIRIEYLARDTGEEYVWGQPLNPQDVRDALAWLREVRNADLSMLPREYDPESVFCRGCPFGGADGGICWEGHITGRDLRTVLYVEDPDAQKWADQLAEARATESAAKKRAAEAKGALEAIIQPTGDVVQAGTHLLRWGGNGLRFVSAPRDVEISP